MASGTRRCWIRVRRVGKRIPHAGRVIASGATKSHERGESRRPGRSHPLVGAPAPARSASHTASALLLAQVIAPAPTLRHRAGRWYARRRRDHARLATAEDDSATARRGGRGGVSGGFSDERCRGTGLTDAVDRLDKISRESKRPGRRGRDQAGDGTDLVRGTGRSFRAEEDVLWRRQDGVVQRSSGSPGVGSELAGPGMSTLPCAGAVLSLGGTRSMPHPDEVREVDGSPLSPHYRALSADGIDLADRRDRLPRHDRRRLSGHKGVPSRHRLFPSRHMTFPIGP